MGSTWTGIRSGLGSVVDWTWTGISSGLVLDWDQQWTRLGFVINDLDLTWTQALWIQDWTQTPGLGTGLGQLPLNRPITGTNM